MGIIFFHKIPALQLLTVVLLNLGSFAFVASSSPYKLKKMNAIEIFNETCVYFLTMTYIFFFDAIVNKDQKWNAGYLALAILLLNLIVNLFLMVFDTIRDIYFLVKSRIRSRKKAKPYIDDEEQNLKSKNRGSEFVLESNLTHIEKNGSNTEIILQEVQLESEEKTSEFIQPKRLSECGKDQKQKEELEKALKMGRKKHSKRKSKRKKSQGNVLKTKADIEAEEAHQNIMKQHRKQSKLNQLPFL